MRILLLNQTFYPDVVATGQYLAMVAEELVRRGHEVTVVTGRRAYDQPETVFANNEIWRGVRIHRVFSTRFGKGAKWRRALDFGSFIASCFFRIVRLPRHDLVVALTTPPLISFIGACTSILWRCRFCYWVMDFNPDEAIAAGWLRAGSLVARILDRISRFSLNRADRIIALDRFMRDRIAGKGIPLEKIAVIPPWAYEDEIRFDPDGREEFRRLLGIGDEFVVMYSGNHSPVHPLDTLIEAARRLRDEKEILFCFVGGGSEFRKVKEIAEAEKLSRVLCRPYQPLNKLAGSLSAGDMQVVVMGDAMLGLVHPCKIYNILGVSSPVLYIGPVPSHVTEIADEAPDSLFFMARHGEPERVAGLIMEAFRSRGNISRSVRLPVSCAREDLLQQFIAVLESGG